MKHLILLILALLLPAGLAAALKPEEVAVVYNADSALSREVMERYCRARKIPREHVFPLSGIGTKDISRADFDLKVRLDLVMQARQNGCSWASGPRGGKVLRAIVLMPDLPLRVKEDPALPSGKLKGTPGNSASLDAELMLLGCEYPVAGPLQNPCYKAPLSSLGENTRLTMVCRIDAPSKEAILRMVDDPVKVEATGLWGWVVVDQGGPYKEGDAWFEAISKMAEARHQPLFHETSKETLAESFPLMTDTIAYFGWYANPANGPFKPDDKSGFRFAPGAIAIHLHSFSGTSVKDQTRWVGALLQRGAAVTAGNVAEPLLAGCIDFEVFYRILLEGGSVAEAGLLATPLLSWQTVLLGDPLYRPFPARPARKPAADNPYAVWKELCTSHGNDMKTLQQAVDQRAGGKHGGTYAEMLAWRMAEKNDFPKAVTYFKKAAGLYKDARDITRAQLLQITCMPAAKQGREAVKAARSMRDGAGRSVFAPAIIRTADAIDPPKKK